jgi:hypothetical protein
MRARVRIGRGFMFYADVKKEGDLAKAGRDAIRQYLSLHGNVALWDAKIVFDTVDKNDKPIEPSRIEMKALSEADRNKK